MRDVPAVSVHSLLRGGLFCAGGMQSAAKRIAGVSTSAIGGASTSAIGGASTSASSGAIAAAIGGASTPAYHRDVVQKDIDAAKNSLRC